MNGASKTVLAIVALEALLVLAALTSHSWTPRGREEDLGRGVLVVTSFIALFAVVSSALAVATVVSGIIWLRALRPRASSHGGVLALGATATAASVADIVFFFGLFS